MKLLVGLCWILFSFEAFSCTDFSGNYLNQEKNSYEITQNKCLSLTMTDADGEQIFLADGKFRVVEESDEMRVSVSSKFIGSNMTVEFRIEYLIKPSPQIPEDLIPTKILSIYTLDAAGNLKMTTTVYNKNDQVMTSDTTIDTKN